MINGHLNLFLNTTIKIFNKNFKFLGVCCYYTYYIKDISVLHFLNFIIKKMYLHN